VRLPHVTNHSQNPSRNAFYQSSTEEGGTDDLQKQGAEENIRKAQMNFSSGKIFVFEITPAGLPVKYRVADLKSGALNPFPPVYLNPSQILDWLDGTF
jgi:hypothetical protein